MRKLLLTAVALTLVVVGIAPLVLAKTIEVPKDYQTIQAAINAAQPGDLILIAPGTYRENLTIRKSIELRGADAGVIVDGSRSRSAPTILIQRTRDVVIQNLEITGGRRGIQVERSQNITIKNNLIQKNRRQGILITEHSQDVQIMENTILDTAPDEGNVLGNGIILNRTKNAHVINNFIARSAWSGLRLLSAVAHIENNTFEENRHYGIEIWPNWVDSPDVPSHATVLHNTLKNNWRAGVFITEESVAAMHSNTILDTQADRDKQYGHGIWVADGAQVSLAENTITGSQGHGLFFESGRVALGANTVTLSAGCGIYIEDGVWLTPTASAALELSGNQQGTACGTPRLLHGSSPSTLTGLTLEPTEATSVLLVRPGEKISVPVRVTYAGLLKVRAVTLTQGASLVLSLFGPGQETPIAQTRSPLPLALTVAVPEETLGARWQVVVENRGESHVLVNAQISAPVRLGSCQDISDEFGILLAHAPDAPPFHEAQCAVLYSLLRAMPTEIRRTVSSITNNPPDEQVAGTYTGMGRINLFGPMLRRTLSFVFIHEMGHAVQDLFVTSSQNARWRELFRLSGRDPENFVSDYARTNHHEDFAETFATYVDDAIGLLQIARERAARGKPLLLEKVKFMAEIFKQLGSDNSISTLVYQVRLKTDDERTRLLTRRVLVSFDSEGLPLLPALIEWEEF
ncbi:MAG: right-handed parallel beta-helix repeat-containing protein [Candidatus Bipolaricaulota bacterium]|nr:right-handed parallel beta-helix repeat-containing protein [Candidatus Bipolaricaulota bacterium]